MEEKIPTKLGVVVFVVTLVVCSAIIWYISAPP
jgi:hypothetical protein